MIEEPFCHLTAAAEELWTTSDYQWDNSRRESPELCVLQRTISGEAFFCDVNGEIYAGPGKVMLFSHNENSTYGYSPGSGEAYRLQFIAFRPGCLRPMFEGLRERFGSVIALSGSGESVLIFEEILRRHRELDFRDSMQISELLCRLFCSLWREQMEGRQGGDPIEYGHFLMHNDPHGQIRLKELALRVGVSREHFIREYTARFGESPGSVLRRLRLEQARAMLSVSNLTLEDIAPACGFGSADAMRRAYHTYFGENPIETRLKRRRRSRVGGPEEHRTEIEDSDAEAVSIEGFDEVSLL